MDGRTNTTLRQTEGHTDRNILGIDNQNVLRINLMSSKKWIKYPLLKCKLCKYLIKSNSKSETAYWFKKLLGKEQTHRDYPSTV